MSVHGIGPAGLPQWLRGPETGRAPQEADGAKESQEQARARSARAETLPVQAPASTPEAEAPGTIPDGVDPELWSLLTADERAHFARFAAMGGVTYGPRTSSASSRPPVQGQRLDLKA